MVWLQPSELAFSRSIWAPCFPSLAKQIFPHQSAFILKASAPKFNTLGLVGWTWKGQKTVSELENVSLHPAFLLLLQVFLFDCSAPRSPRQRWGGDGAGDGDAKERQNCLVVAGSLGTDPDVTPRFCTWSTWTPNLDLHIYKVALSTALTSGEVIKTQWDNVHEVLSTRDLINELNWVNYNQGVKELSTASQGMGVLGLPWPWPGVMELALGWRGWAGGLVFHPGNERIKSSLTRIEICHNLNNNHSLSSICGTKWHRDHGGWKDSKEVFQPEWKWKHNIKFMKCN